MIRLLLILAFVFSFVPATVHAQGRNGNGPSGNAACAIAIYQGGVIVASVAPGSPIEVRGVGCNRNQTYFVGIDGQALLAVVQPDANRSFAVFTTAPTLPYPAYRYYAAHFSGGGFFLIDSIATLAVV